MSNNNSNIDKMIINKQMAYTLKEFLSQFETFAHKLKTEMDYRQIEYSNDAIENNSAQIILSQNPQQNPYIMIQLTVLAPRKLGMLNLPCLQAELVFHEIHSQQRQDFIRAFDFSFRKGGG